MDKFYTKRRYTIKDIDNLIKYKAEESLNLEFKSSGSLDFSDPKLSDEKKTELSRDVSSFANSEGGIIVYGVREKNHVAKSKTFIDGNIITKERIEQIIQNRIKRKIPGLKVIPIREDKDITKSFYLIKIPESQDAPHMAYDGAYYKRNNFNRIQYMEFEVRREYLRIRKSLLDIELPVINDTSGNFHKKGDKTVGHFRIWFHVKNIGKILEQNFKQEILIPKTIHKSYHSEPNPIQKYKTHTLLEDHKFSIPSEQTIFPEETLRLCSTYIYLKEEHKDEMIKMKLYYSGGIVENKFTISEMFENQYKREDEVNFQLEYQKKS